jgi:hypothetical protein
MHGAGRMDRMDEETQQVIVLSGWSGPWDHDDPDANFKSDIALYALVDPLTTVRNLSTAVGVPVGALCHYVLAKWATAGSGGLLELGPTMIRRLTGVCDAAEAVGTDDARLEAYAQLCEMLAWLRLPIDQPEICD